jgi:hypothetical protein
MSETTYDPILDTPVDLSRYDDDYRRAKQADTPPPFRPIPDGKYQVIVETVELTKTRTTGNPMLKWRLRIAGPTMAERILWKNAVITERSIPFLTKELTLCGVNMQSLSELPSRLPDLVNLRLEVMKRGRTDGPDDVYFDKNLTAVPNHVESQPAAYDQADRSVHPIDDDLNDDLPF